MLLIFLYIIYRNFFIKINHAYCQKGPIYNLMVRYYGDFIMNLFNQKYKCYMFILSFIGFLFSIYLIINQILNPPYCPLLLGVPACFVVMLSYGFIILSLIIEQKEITRIIQIICILCGIVVGLYFSIRQILCVELCPQIFEIPLCYASLFLFIIIGLIKIIEK